MVDTCSQEVREMKLEEVSQRIREIEEKIEAEQHTVMDALLDNRERREEARRDVEDARQELIGLLVRGKDARLDVSKMAREARISRETAHKLLRQAKGDDDA
jgi:AraC-like DNA-binding protein